MAASGDDFVVSRSEPQKKGWIREIERRGFRMFAWIDWLDGDVGCVPLIDLMPCSEDPIEALAALKRAQEKEEETRRRPSQPIVEFFRPI